jgi:hypothetical protein
MANAVIAEIGSARRIVGTIPLGAVGVVAATGGVALSICVARRIRIARRSSIRIIGLIPVRVIITVARRISVPRVSAVSAVVSRSPERRGRCRYCAADDTGQRCADAGPAAAKTVVMVMASTAAPARNFDLMLYSIVKIIGLATGVRASHCG